MSSLDATKAFDYVDHAILIDKLFRRGVPSCLLEIINNWYCKLSAVVGWNHVLSAEFRIFSGVRQGDVLSPVLCNLYVDDLIQQLEVSGNGCSVWGIFSVALCMRTICCYYLHLLLVCRP